MMNVTFLDAVLIDCGGHMLVSLCKWYHIFFVLRPVLVNH